MEHQERKVFYITFGQVHTHSLEGVTLDKDSVLEVHADNEEQARDWAHGCFKDVYAFIYREKPDMSYFPRGIVKIIEV